MFNRPLYYLIILEIAVGGIGAYTGLSFMQTFYLGGNLNFELTMLRFL